MEHVRYCYPRHYPRSMAFLVVMSILTFVTLILEVTGAFDA